MQQYVKDRDICNVLSRPELLQYFPDCNTASLIDSPSNSDSTYIRYQLLTIVLGFAGQIDLFSLLLWN